MQSIPLHDLAGMPHEPKFQIDLWRKKVTRYDASLPHRHNYFEALIFLKGGGEHEVDFTSYPIKSNAIHFLQANQVHVVRRANGSSGFNIAFAEEFLPPGLNARDFDFFKMNAYPVLHPSRKDFAELMKVLNAIRTEFFSEPKKGKREALQSLLQFFLIKAQRLYEADSGKHFVKKPKCEFAERLEQLIEKNYRLHWRPREYARALNMSVTHLNALCKKQFSKSTEKLIHERLLLEIKRLLVYSDKSVKEIAYAFNFEESGYFIRIFKKHVGVTPQAYRMSVRR